MGEVTGNFHDEAPIGLSGWHVILHQLMKTRKGIISELEMQREALEFKDLELAIQKQNI